ncbi:MAG: hypothetical protein PHS18_00825 [Sphaerochaetaceae bacterium]|nr:hypothetical protein [Sphaerochaetaceae bacterium]
MKVMDRLRNTPRYDMDRPPRRQMNILRPLTWLLSYPEVWLHKLKINKVGMDGIKPPFLLLCTHHAFIDFKVTTATLFPNRANYVVAIDGFIGREWLLRSVGCICKRKFTNDLNTVRHIKKVLHDQKDVLALYPEARYSLAGTTAVLPASLGKIVRMLKVPVVVLNMHGHYLNSPCWNLKKRGNRIEADMTCILTPEKIEKMPVSNINHVIREAFEYDEYRWQKEHNIVIDYPKRAEGLHKVLYQCPHCLTEYKMETSGALLKCGNCHKEWEMGVLGDLKAVRPAHDEQSLHTEFPHIPDWYEFERLQVRDQVERGTYRYEIPVYVDALPNARGYIPMGNATLTHDAGGFVLEGVFENEGFRLEKPVLSMYSCHIEYEYFGKGDCIDLSTLDDTYYIYPKTPMCSVTKIALATEELFDNLAKMSLRAEA